MAKTHSIKQQKATPHTKENSRVTSKRFNQVSLVQISKITKKFVQKQIFYSGRKKETWTLTSRAEHYIQKKQKCQYTTV